MASAVLRSASLFKSKIKINFLISFVVSAIPSFSLLLLALQQRFVHVMQEQDKGWKSLSGREGVCKVSSRKTIYAYAYTYTYKTGRLYKFATAQVQQVMRGFLPQSKSLPLLITFTCLSEVLHKEKPHLVWQYQDWPGLSSAATMAMGSL